ncbi:MAG: pyridoxamine 5'-phosphate oxidase family protein [Hyphomicrobiaceae bacterium]
MDAATRKQIVSIIDDVDDLNIATVRSDGFPQTTTASYVNDGLSTYFGTSSDSQKARNTGFKNDISLAINRTYSNWNEIEGLLISGSTAPVTDPAEMEKVATLLFNKFPQVKDDMPPDMPPEAMVIYRIEPQFISLLDYRKGYDHTELFKLQVQS